MRTLHVCVWYQSEGGAEKMLFQMLDGLDGLDGQVENIIVTQKASGQVKDRRKKYFIDGLQYDFSDRRPIRALFRNWKIMREIQGIIKIEQPDIIHNHNVLNPFVNRALRKSGKPVVFHVHDPRLFCFTYWKLKPKTRDTWIPGEAVKSKRSGFWKSAILDRPVCNDPIGRACLKCMGRNVETKKLWAFLYNWQLCRKSKFTFIIPAKFQAKMMIRNGFTMEIWNSPTAPSGSNIRYLPNFTEVKDPYVQVARRRVDTVLFVGRASYEKGIMFLLEALNRIRDIKWRLILCTSGPQLGQVKDRIEELRLVRRVKIVSTHSPRRLRSLYQKATVCVMPSVWHETFGLVGIEAMANKCPVIAFDVGGVREWCQICLPPKDIAGLSSLIEAFLLSEIKEDDYNAYHQMIRDNFSPSVYIPNLLKIYTEVINEHDAR